MNTDGGDILLAEPPNTHTKSKGIQIIFDYPYKSMT